MDALKNFAYSTVATAPSPASSGTSLVVAAGQGALFPAVSFNAVVWPAGAQPLSTNAEIVRVTAISTDTFTITRAQEGSSARSIVVGDQIAQTITKKTLDDLAGGYGTAFPSSPSNGDEFVLVDSTSNPTYQWRFRYNSSEATYKWEFIGGAPYVAQANLNATINTKTQVGATGWYYDPASMSFTLPCAGDFLIEGIVQISQASGGANFIEADVFTGSTLGLQTQGGVWVITVNTVNTLSIMGKVTGVASGTVIGVAGFAGSVANYKFSGLNLVKITPFRCI